MTGPVVERCDSCGEDTEHAVQITVEETGDGSFSNQPHRTTECLECGETDTEEMGYT